MLRQHGIEREASLVEASLNPCRHSRSRPKHPERRLAEDDRISYPGFKESITPAGPEGMRL